jgi:hypothetical protein
MIFVLTTMKDLCWNELEVHRHSGLKEGQTIEQEYCPDADT